MKTFNKLGIGIFFAFISMNANAQTDKGLIRLGNKDFKNGNYSEAEVNYRKSLDKEYNPKAPELQRETFPKKLKPMLITILAIL